MKDYELGFILNPEVSEEETRAVVGRVEQIVANYGGQIVKVNQWGRRRLAYPIERHRDGIYIFIDMILTPETPAELDRNLKVSEVVMRHMIKSRDAKAVQKEREEREAREARAAAEAAAAPVEEVVAVEGEPDVDEAIAVSEDEIAEAPAASDEESSVEA